LLKSRLLKLIMPSSYAMVKKAIQKRRAWANTLKEGKPCQRCGGVFPVYVMDWHHREPSQKSFGIGRGSFKHSKEHLSEEIAKCDLLCSNCHRIVEYEERFKEKEFSIADE
jgi:hypothetical protein